MPTSLYLPRMQEHLAFDIFSVCIFVNANVHIDEMADAMDAHTVVPVHV